MGSSPGGSVAAETVRANVAGQAGSWEQSPPPSAQIRLGCDLGHIRPGQLVSQCARGPCFFFPPSAPAAGSASIQVSLNLARLLCGRALFGRSGILLLICTPRDATFELPGSVRIRLLDAPRSIGAVHRNAEEDVVCPTADWMTARSAFIGLYRCARLDSDVSSGPRWCNEAFAASNPWRRSQSLFVRPPPMDIESRARGLAPPTRTCCPAAKSAG